MKRLREKNKAQQLIKGVTQVFSSQRGAPVDVAAWLSSQGSTNLLLLVLFFFLFYQLFPSGVAAANHRDSIWYKMSDALPDTSLLSWAMAKKRLRFFFLV